MLKSTVRSRRRKATAWVAALALLLQLFAPHCQRMALASVDTNSSDAKIHNWAAHGQSSAMSAQHEQHSAPETGEPTPVMCAVCQSLQHMGANHPSTTLPLPDPSSSDAGIKDQHLINPRLESAGSNRQPRAPPANT